MSRQSRFGPADFRPVLGPAHHRREQDAGGGGSRSHSQCLASAGGSRDAGGGIIGMNRKTLRKRIAQYGLGERPAVEPLGG